MQTHDSFRMNGSELVQQWLQSLASQRRLSPDTQRAYAATLNRFLAHLGETHGRPADLALFESLAATDFRGFLARRRAESLSNTSAARELSAIRTFVLWLGERHGATVSGLDGIASPKVKRGLPRPVSPADARALADTAGEMHDEPWLQARDTAVLLLLYGAGLRIGEALSLTGKDVGKIDIFGSFALVDIPDGLSPEIVDRLARTRVAGRPLHIRVDTGPSGPQGARRPSRGDRVHRSH